MKTFLMAALLGLAFTIIMSSVSGAVVLVPNDVLAAYDINPLLQSGFTGKGVKVAVVNKGIDSSFNDDLNGFSSKYGLPAPQISLVRPYGSAGTDQEVPDGETTADVELIHAVAPDAQILVVLVGTHSLLDGFSYVIDNNAADIAVLSPSWAYWGQWARDVAESYNSKYSESVSKKITLIAASNDWGSNNTVPWGTVIGDFWTDHLPDSYLLPQYSPYVTAVGGTVLTVRSGAYVSEKGWDRSGGGPSNLFTQPSWQTGLGIPRNGFRNIPDIALNAACETAYAFYWKGKSDTFCGTSGSAPVFAGIIADITQAVGGRLGFLNPSLYSIASSDPNVFHDVISGCSLVKVGSTTQNGYCAAQGWDFVTGWGSVDSVMLARHLAPNATIIPEFPNWQAVMLFTIMATVSMVLTTRRRHKEVD